VALEEDELTGLSTIPSTFVKFHVECQFLLDMDSFWTLVGVDRSYNGRGTVRHVIINPDEQGAFVVQAQMNNRITSATGPCMGAYGVGNGDIKVSGNLDSNNMLHVTVTYGSVSNFGTESCKGKGRTGTAQAQPLSFDFQILPDKRVYDTSKVHVLDSDMGAFTGNTDIHLTRTTP
jgi:hypothetical protein